MRLAVRLFVLQVMALVVACGCASYARAQADYPFRDKSLSDEARIQDFLKRLTPDEKVLLMSDHPKFERLGVVFSGQVEGLHGEALGGPANCGCTRTATRADHDISAGKRAGCHLGRGSAEEDWSARGI
jgi:hypothetical protein